MSQWPHESSWLKYTSVIQKDQVLFIANHLSMTFSILKTTEWKLGSFGEHSLGIQYAPPLNVTFWSGIKNTEKNKWVIVKIDFRVLKNYATAGKVLSYLITTIHVLWSSIERNIISCPMCGISMPSSSYNCNVPRYFYCLFWLDSFVLS